MVRCGAGELALLRHPGLEPGYYLVGSGDTGLAASLLLLSLAYSSTLGRPQGTSGTRCPGVMALAIRRPPPGHSALHPSSSRAPEHRAVPPSAVLATPQYWLLFSSATLLATGGMAVFSVASPMVQGVFAPSFPHLVTPAAASLYLM